MSTIFYIGGAFFVAMLLLKIIKNHYKKNAKTNNCSDDKIPMPFPESSKKIQKKF